MAAKSSQVKKRLDPQDLAFKHLDAKVEFEHEGNFTIAIVKKRRVVKVGVAKKSPLDENIPQRGEQIALYRALVKLDKALK